MTNPQRRYHLLIDISACPSELLSNSEQLSKIIQQLAQLSEMQILFGPKIIKGSPDNPGFTGLAVIDYSHIAVHTFPTSGALFLDLFSCKPFPVSRIVKFVKAIFAVDDSQLTIHKINLDKGDAQSLS
jgi:S-adenosylmethionine decarboxylase